jgi:lysozyme family protein
MVTLTPALRDEYQGLFDTCIIRPERQETVEDLIEGLQSHQDRYQHISDETGIPWYIVGVIHNMESSQNFTRHLHNGDPLTARTTHVPAGRPKTGKPPFTWEQSAIDALRGHRLDEVTDWTVPGALFQLERFNGFGYRLRNTGVFTPYLWSFSTHYTRGKFTGDGVFSSTAVSKQCGAAVLLRRMAEMGIIDLTLDAQAPGAGDAEQMGTTVRFSMTERTEAARHLQMFLNRFPGIFVKVDGVAGEKTSDAFKKVTGHFLLGDPRA